MLEVDRKRKEIRVGEEDTQQPEDACEAEKGSRKMTSREEERARKAKSHSRSGNGSGEGCYNKK